MIITIAGQKGGIGKSTIALNIALTMSKSTKHQPVALLDADIQGSIVETIEPTSRLIVEAVDENPHSTAGAYHRSHTVIIDTPPHSHKLMYQAAAVSDLIIMPVQPSPFDVRAFVRTVKALMAVKKKYNRALVYMFLLNQIVPRRKLAGSLKGMIEDVYPGVSIFKTVIHQREAYRQSIVSGQSVVEYAPSSPAAKEIKALVREIRKMEGVDHGKR